MAIESDAVRTIYYYFLVRPICLKACYQYYILNISPSDIAHIHSCNKFVIRECISRVRTNSSRTKVNELIKELNRIGDLKLIDMFRDGYKYKCMWCGTKFHSKTTIAKHIVRFHLNELKELINKVLTAGIQI